MKVVQCENKHFYDADKYAVCPHCVPAGEKKNIQQEGKGNAAPSLPKRLAEKPCIRCGKGVAEDENFCRFCGMRAKPAVTQAQRSAVNNLPVNNSLESGKNNINSGIIKNKPTASNNDEKTVGLLAMGGRQENAAEPVTGWLVCTEGIYRGMSFNIVTGSNAVGRDGSNRIVLSRDSSVLPAKHTFIIFEPKKKVFYIQPGAGKSTTFLNGNVFQSVTPLNARDKITIGRCSFIFIPLCGKDFSWSDYTVR